jgi:hypothetical protein
MLLLPALAGCEQRPMGTPPPVTLAGWEFVYQFHDAIWLTTAWSVAPGTVHVGFERYQQSYDGTQINDRSSVYYYDGTDWEDLLFPFTEHSGDIDIWGTSLDNIFVADGRLQRYDGANWIEQPVEADVVYGTAFNDLYAADDKGIYRYDGEYWDLLYSFENRRRTVYALWAAYGPSAGPSLFASAYPGVIQLHGNEWREVDLPLWINGLWGSAPDDVYGVGGTGYPLSSGYAAMWHFDGNDWAEVEIPQVWELHCVWGSGANDVYAAGSNGTMLHYDGNTWEAVEAGTAKTLYDMTGSGPNDIFAVGKDQKVLHFDGGEWISVWNDDPPRESWKFWAESPERIAAAGLYKSVYIMEDGAWRETVLASAGIITDLWGTSIDNLLAASSSGRIHRFDGVGWTVEVDSIEGHLIAVHGTGPSDIHVVGRGAFYHFDGSVWRNLPADADGEFLALWATDPYNAFAVGWNGAIMHYDGNGWNRMESGVTDELTDVWGASGDDVYAVGRAGLLHYDGRAWRRVPVYNGEGLYRIMGRARDDIIAFYNPSSHPGCQLRYDGTKWNREESSLETAEVVISAGGTIMQITRNSAIYRGIP